MRCCRNNMKKWTAAKKQCGSPFFYTAEGARLRSRSMLQRINA